MASENQVTVCFLLNNNKVLLFLIDYLNGLKKWNGIGGYIEKGENVGEGLVREIKEEIGIEVNKNRFIKKLVLKRFDKHNNREFELNVFTVENFTDNFQIIDPQIKEAKWFEFNEIPFDQMWPDNKEWLPQVLKDYFVGPLE